MGLRRLGCALAGLIALTCLATACGSSRLAAVGRQTASSRKPRSRSLVALGDSVPRGTNCHCKPYSPLTAKDLTATSGDVVAPTACGTRVSCYAPRIPTVRRNLAAIVRRVHALTTGHKVLVVLLDYWNVWLGGRYAAAKGEAYVDAAEQVTDDVNRVIKSTAARSRSAYVDLRAAFKGPNYAYDETRYLSNDGDHPNAAGHRRIAAAAEAVIEKALHI